jgi:hypothetical protein
VSRVDSGRVTRLPFSERETCANGHRWTPQSTRWRIRTDKGETQPTRDCLICKRVSEGKRRERLRISERVYR